MENLSRDVKYALRMLRRNPGFASVAIFILALGIGTMTSLFSFLNGILLRPLPYEHSEKLVRAYGIWENGNREGVSSPDFWDYRHLNTVFESTAAATKYTPYYSLTGFVHPEQLVGRGVSSGYLYTLGVKPALGREFLPKEENAANRFVCMISYGLWKSHFEGKPDALGKSLVLDAAHYTIVGVIPRTFDFLGSTDLWFPLELPNQPPFRAVRFLSMVARLKNGVSLETSQSEMNVIAKSLEAAYPASNKTWRMSLAPLANEVVLNIRPVLLLLMGSVIVVMLIVAFNLANLMLSWASAHSRETAVCSALGATKMRMARETLTFTMVLSLIGGTLGCALAVGGVELLKKLATAKIARLDEVNVDLRVLGFGLLITVLTGLFFGLAPALRVWQPVDAAALRARSQVGGTRSSLRALLVVSQISLSFILLSGAGLLIRSLWELQKVDPGFHTLNLMSTRLFLPGTKYSSDQKRIAFWQGLVEKVNQLPGVKGAAVVTELPLSGQDNPTPFSATTPGGRSFVVNTRGVSPEYLSLMGIPLHSGRGLTREDQPNTPHIVVINQTAARAIFGTANPIGKNLTFDFGPYEATVVGVVGDIHHSGLAADPPREAYFPIAQTPLNSYNLVVSTYIAPQSLENQVREAVWSLDPDQSVGNFEIMDELIRDDLSRARFPAVLAGFFAAFALVLASVGLFGTLSYLVSQRAQEIAVRMAVGASKLDVLRLFLMQGGKFTGLGLLIGLTCSIVLDRIIGGLLFGVSQFDAATYVTCILTVTAISILASLIPACRAAGLDPLKTLRSE